MAQVCFADHAWADDFKFAPALAKTFATQHLVDFAGIARPRGHLRVATTALVPKLLSAFFAVGILFQPVHWLLRAVALLHFHNDAARIRAAVDGQRFTAAQTSARRKNLLAPIQRLQPAGPDVLKYKS